MSVFLAAFRAPLHGLYASDAKKQLLYCGVAISEEENALYIAILLHDIGMGLSRTLCIVEDVHHEEISLLFMHQLNTEFNGQLDLSIQVFKGIIIVYLCCNSFSQLDMDRMDYLKRDSFIQV
jgi:HD superfamily phosphohydrolase